ncbi:MAG: AglZ/HisF2 family acetamidino modification protein [Alphaproteobacteria bacterium]
MRHDSGVAQVMPRYIPCLLVDGGKLVKTIKFCAPKYIGDPMNAVRIFNEKGADELIFLDIAARRAGKPPDLELIRQIASQCFMPFAYGGGITTLEQIRAILGGGAEKVVLNTVAGQMPELLTQAAAEFGSQSIVAGMDVKKSWLGRQRVVLGARQRTTGQSPVDYARALVARGAGEIFINDIDRDGTRSGYDLALIQSICAAVDVPVVACGGAGQVSDLQQAVAVGAAAAAAGSLFVLYGKHRAVLITYPDRNALEKTG